MPWRELIPLVLGSAVWLSVVMVGAWVRWYRTRNSGWIDAIWTFGLGLGAAAGALVAANCSPRSLIAAVCAVVWSARLGLHIVFRTRLIADDPRYASLIADWGHHAAYRMFWFLQIQAWASVPMALSILLAATNPVRLWRISDGLAVALILIAVIGEALADAQLQRFRSIPENRSKVCDVGLWRYSRHPNYFFEWMVWLTYPLLAIAPSNPLGALSLFGPACIYYLLVHVSGIPPLEKHMLATRGEEFRHYQARTNAFFLGPPRSK